MWARTRAARQPDLVAGALVSAFRDRSSPLRSPVRRLRAVGTGAAARAAAAADLNDASSDGHSGSDSDADAGGYTVARATRGEVAADDVDSDSDPSHTEAFRDDMRLHRVISDVAALSTSPSEHAPACADEAADGGARVMSPGTIAARPIAALTLSPLRGRRQ
jgi:hypothetical protein